MSLVYTMSCVSDLSLVPKRVTGTRRVAERLARRLSTPRGTLLDGATSTGATISNGDWGMDITNLVEDVLTTRALADMRAEILAQVLKDPDVDTATVSLTTSTANKSLTIKIQGYGQHGIVEATYVATSAGVFIQ